MLCENILWFYAGARRACILGINPHPCHALHRPLDGQCYLYSCCNHVGCNSELGSAYSCKVTFFGLEEERRQCYSMLLLCTGDCLGCQRHQPACEGSCEWLRCSFWHPKLPGALQFLCLTQILLFPSCQSHKPTVQSVWRKGFFGILLSDIVLKEMALGFTSDIAKNNLGESFYRTFQTYFVVFPCLFISFRLSNLSRQPNPRLCRV